MAKSGDKLTRGSYLEKDKIGLHFVPLSLFTQLKERGKPSDFSICTPAAPFPRQKARIGGGSYLAATYYCNEASGSEGVPALTSGQDCQNKTKFIALAPATVQT